MTPNSKGFLDGYKCMKNIRCANCKQTAQVPRLTQCCQCLLCSACVGKLFKDKKSISCVNCGKRLKFDGLRERPYITALLRLYQQFTSSLDDYYTALPAPSQIPVAINNDDCSSIVRRSSHKFNRSLRVMKKKVTYSSRQRFSVLAAATENQDEAKQHDKVKNWLESTPSSQAFTEVEENQCNEQCNVGSVDDVVGSAGSLESIAGVSSPSKTIQQMLVDKNKAAVLSSHKVNNEECQKSVYDFVPSQKAPTARVSKHSNGNISEYKSHTKRFSNVGDINVDMYDEFDKVCLQKNKPIASRSEEEEDSDEIDKSDGDYSAGSSDNWIPEQEKKTERRRILELPKKRRSYAARQTSCAKSLGKQQLVSDTFTRLDRLPKDGREIVTNSVSGRLKRASESSVDDEIKKKPKRVVKTLQSEDEEEEELMPNNISKIRSEHLAKQSTIAMSPGWGRAERVSKEYKDKQPKLKALDVSIHRLSLPSSIADKTPSPSKMALDKNAEKTNNQRNSSRFLQKRSSTRQKEAKQLNVSQAGDFHGFGEEELVISPKKELLDEIIQNEAREIAEEHVDKLEESIQENTLADIKQETDDIKTPARLQLSVPKLFTKQKNSPKTLEPVNNPDLTVNIKKEPELIDDKSNIQRVNVTPSEDSGIESTKRQLRSKSTSVGDKFVTPKRKTFSLHIDTQDLTSGIDNSPMTQDILDTLAQAVKPVTEPCNQPPLVTSATSKLKTPEKRTVSTNNNAPELNIVTNRNYYILSTLKDGFRNTDPTLTISDNIRVECKVPNDIMIKILNIKNKFVHAPPTDHIFEIVRIKEDTTNSKTNNVVKSDRKGIGTQTNFDCFEKEKVCKVETIHMATQTDPMQHIPSSPQNMEQLLERQSIQKSGRVLKLATESIDFPQLEEASPVQLPTKRDTFRSPHKQPTTSEKLIKIFKKTDIQYDSRPADGELEKSKEEKSFIYQKSHTNPTDEAETSSVEKKKPLTQLRLSRLSTKLETVKSKSVETSASNQDNINEKVVEDSFLSVDQEYEKVLANVQADLPKRRDKENEFPKHGIETDEIIILDSPEAESDGSFLDESPPPSQESETCTLGNTAFIPELTHLSTQYLQDREASIIKIKGKINQLSKGLSDASKMPPPKVDSTCVRIADTDDDVDYVESTPQASDRTFKGLDGRQLCFAMSGLNKTSQDKVLKLAQLTGAKLMNDPAFVSDITHLIVDVSRRQRPNKTLKFILAVAYKKWVVNMNWISHCLDRGFLLKEEDYEVFDCFGGQGPFLSRLSSKPIFSHFDLQFYVFDADPSAQLVMPVEFLKRMLTVAGGTVCERLHELDRRKCCIVLLPDEDMAVDVTNILYKQKILVLTSFWAISSVETHRIFPVVHYTPSCCNYSETLWEELQARYPEELFTATTDDLDEDEDEDDEEDDEEGEDQDSEQEV